MSFGSSSISNTFAASTNPDGSLFAATTTNGDQSATTQRTNDPFSDPNGPFANLNLSTQQQQQIQAILSENTNATPLSPTQLFSKIENVLTPAQQQTLQNDLETVQSQHHHHHHRPASTSDSTTAGTSTSYSSTGTTTTSSSASSLDTSA